MEPIKPVHDDKILNIAAVLLMFCYFIISLTTIVYCFILLLSK